MNNPEPKVANLDDLAEALNASTAIYHEGRIIDQRYGVVSALSAVHQYLIAQGIDPRDLEPIFRPIDALAELENSRLDPLFVSQREGGKPSRSNDQLVRMGTLSALADFWLQELKIGRNSKSAVAEAARAIRGAWSGDITAAQLTSARALVHRADTEHRLAIDTAANARAALHSLLAVNTARSAFDIFVKRLNEAAASPALGSGVGLSRADSANP